MDYEIEKELERIRNLSFDELALEGLIVPERNTDWKPSEKPIELMSKKPASEVLIEMRKQERY